MCVDSINDGRDQSNDERECHLGYDESLMFCVHEKLIKILGSKKERTNGQTKRVNEIQRR